MNPADAVAQSLRIEVAGGDDTPQLDGESNWVWTVFYDTDDNGGAATIQFGVQATGSNLLSGSVDPSGLFNGGVEVGVAGQPVFGWEAVDAPDGNGTLPSGFQIDLEQNVFGEAYFSFLTGDLPGNTTIELAQFVTTGPSTTALTSGLSIVGAFGADGAPAATLPGTDGVIGQSDGSTFAAVANSVTVILGDADLDGSIDIDDYNVVAANFGTTDSDLGWLIGDFNGDRSVNALDLNVFDSLVEDANYTAEDSDATNDAEVIDAADYTIWRDRFETQDGETIGNTSNLVADGDDDGAVTQLDYDVWADRFGLNLFDPGVVEFSAVATPEPTTSVLALLAASAAMRRRSR